MTAQLFAVWRTDCRSEVLIEAIVRAPGASSGWVCLYRLTDSELLAARDFHQVDGWWRLPWRLAAFLAPPGPP